MRIGLIVQNYRQKNHLSMESFAKRCNLSKAYIGLLEQGIHPKTKKPISPSVDTVRKIAEGMNMDFEDFFKLLDEDITLNDEPSMELDDASSKTAQHLANYSRLTAEDQCKVDELIALLQQKEPSSDEVLALIQRIL